MILSIVDLGAHYEPICQLYFMIKNLIHVVWLYLLGPQLTRALFHIFAQPLNYTKSKLKPKKFPAISTN